jgi:hypothetical protein
MSELPSEYGVNAYGPRARAGMSRDARKAHERLSSLPTQRHVARPAPTRSDAAIAAAERVRSARLLNGTQTRGVTPGVSPNAQGKAVRYQILTALREGPKTTLELCALVGAKKIAARVSELRNEGYDIAAKRKSAGMTTYVLVRAA